MFRPQSRQVSAYENEYFFQAQGLNPDNEWVMQDKMVSCALII